MMKLPAELDEKNLLDAVSREYWTQVEAIVRDCANTALMVLGGPSHKVSENSDIYGIQDHALAMASKAILKRYGLE